MSNYPEPTKKIMRCIVPLHINRRFGSGNSQARSDALDKWSTVQIGWRLASRRANRLWCRDDLGAFCTWLFDLIEEMPIHYGLWLGYDWVDRVFGCQFRKWVACSIKQHAESSWMEMEEQFSVYSLQCMLSEHIFTDHVHAGLYESYHPTPIRDGNTTQSFQEEKMG